MINIVDLFSGAGGLTEGFRGSEFNIVSHVEMDKAACQTLQVREIYYHLKNNNNLNNYNEYLAGNLSFSQLTSSVPESITNKIINLPICEEHIQSIFNRIDAELSENSVHGIIGGPPCQAYSTIGRARNESKKHEDQRIYLYKYYIEFLRKYSPDFFIFENVKGLLSYKDVDGNLLFPKIEKDFQNALGENTYVLEHQIINSADFGVPQKRERLIIFGRKHSFNGFNFFDDLSNLKTNPPTLNELFYDLPIMKNGETNNDYRPVEPVEFVKKFIRTEEFPLSQNISRKNNLNDLEIYKLVVQEKLNTNNNLKYSDLPQELIKHKKSNIFLDRFKALQGDSISHTVVAHISKDGHYYIHPDINQNRSISVREAARIQTFPDDFYFENSRTAAFKQIGNAVPPLLSKAFGKVIMNVLSRS